MLQNEENKRSVEAVSADVSKQHKKKESERVLLK
jgi:hypothetical protein